MTTKEQAKDRLVVRRLIRATPEEVFDAWTDAASIAEWMCPGNTRRAEAKLDLRVGGKFRILMKGDHEEFDHHGEYRIVEPPRRLVFTWISQGTDNQSTLVTVDFLPVDRYTEMVLTHENFVNPAAVPEHEKGWTDIAVKLAAYFEQKAQGADKSDFRMTLAFAVPADRLYEQFSTAEGVRNWWTEFCEVEERVGGKAAFRFPQADFYALVNITRLDPGRCVEWLCTDSKHPVNSGFDNLRDWVGTTLRFEINAVDAEHSQLKFTHAGLAPLECFGVCSNSWSYYLNDSLRDYLERGGGKPYRDASAA